MSYQSEFVADPVDFMKRNVVRPQFLYPTPGGKTLNLAESRPIVLTIKKLEGGSVIGRRDGFVYYFSLDTAGLSHEEKVPIYWLGYKEKDAIVGQLTGASRYMFTALMNGCTLGVGSQAGDGACRVVHANSLGAGHGEPQRAAQAAQVHAKLGDARYRMVQPASYQATSTGAMDTESKFVATNFGVNESGTWAFFSHRWKAIDGRFDGRYLNAGCDRARPVPPLPPRP